MDAFQHLLPNFDHLGNFGYLIVFLFSIGESLAFVGTIIPGATIVVLAGFAASRGVMDIGDLIWFSSLGAILGDGISYYFGHTRHSIFKEGNKVLKIAHLNKGKEFFKKYGNTSVFFGRFIGPLRAVIPFIAGAVRMDISKFLFWNILSGIIWAASHILLGYFFGSISSQIDKSISRIGGLLFLITLAVGILWFAVKKSRYIFEYLKSFTRQMIIFLANKNFVKQFQSNHTTLYEFFTSRFKRENFLGLPLTILFLIFFVGLGAFLGLAEDVASLEPIVNLDASITAYLFAHRSPELVKVFLMITSMGKWTSVLAISILTTGLLIYKRKKIYLVSYLSVLVGNEATMYSIKLLINRARPASDIAYYIEKSPSFPSGHSAISMAMYGYLIYLLAKIIRTWNVRLRIIFLGTLLILAIGFSRIYLGVHYFSDVIGGFVLGGLWLLWGITLTELLLERSRRKS